MPIGKTDIGNSIGSNNGGKSGGRSTFFIHGGNLPLSELTLRRKNNTLAEMLS